MFDNERAILEQRRERLNNEHAMLEQHLTWLKGSVLPGFERRKDTESIRRTLRQIDNIEWRIATGKLAPLCGWRKLYREHPEDCAYCARHRKRLALNASQNAISGDIPDRDTSEA